MIRYPRLVWFLFLITLSPVFFASDTLAGAVLSIGEPSPTLCGGIVSHIPIMAGQIEAPGMAAFDLTVTISTSNPAIQVHSVNVATDPPGLPPGRQAWRYDENGVTFYLPLRIGGASDRHSSTLGVDFMGGAGDDGIFELKNQSLSDSSARLAYAYQSKSGTNPLTSGVLADLFVYIGRRVPASTTIEVTLSPAGVQRLAAFDGVPIVPETLSGRTSRVFHIVDVNRDLFVDLRDAILLLRVMNRMRPQDVQLADVDGDSSAGLPEVIYILQGVAELRQIN